MGNLLSAIHSVDLSVFHFLNRFAGHAFFARLASLEENCNLLNGGVILALYWSLWFRTGDERQKTRRDIVAILAGALLAVTAAELLKWCGLPGGASAFCFALAFGVAVLSRRLAIPVVTFAVGWISLPRMFLGQQYVSGVVVDAVLGIALVWICLKARWIQSEIVTPVLKFAEAKPEFFCAAAFLVTFEMGTMFNDVRSVGGAAVHLVQTAPHYPLALAALGSVAALGFWALARIVILNSHRGTSETMAPETPAPCLPSPCLPRMVSLSPIRGATRVFVNYLESLPGAAALSVRTFPTQYSKP